MGGRLALCVALSLMWGCGDDERKNDDGEDAGARDLSTPEGKMALREELLATADDYTFASPPPTTADDCDVTLSATGEGDADQLIETIENASSFTTVCLSPGSYAMDKSVVISTAANITVKGTGKDPADTVLDFAGHNGDKGFDVTTPGFWIENLWIKNTNGNGVEVKADGKADNPTVYRKVKVSWDVADGATLDCRDGDPRRMHGAYSVYPTKSSYVVVEFSEVEGASDAGLYVGQVEHAIVRHNRVVGNVAGLEVENSRDVVVYDNYASGNAGGILALQEPGLTRLTNEDVLIRDNVVEANNACNFARPNTTVANIPAGTGLMSLGGRNVEFRDNVVRDNDAAGLLIVSNVLLAFLSGEEPDFPEGYDPYATRIYVNGNTFEGNATGMLSGDAGAVAGAAGGLKTVTWDGLRSDENATAADAQICLGDTPPEFVDLTQDQCEMPSGAVEFIMCVMTNKSNDATASHACAGGVEVESFL